MRAPPETSPRRALPTVAEVAAKAGVSTATVDRVLNRRAGVRAATASRVVAAAEALGYVADSSVFSTATQRPMRLLFLLPAGPNRFLSLLGRAIADAKTQFEAFAMRPTVERIESFRPDLLARRLREAGREADGVVFMALEDPAVRDAVDALAGRGVPAVTIISDIGASRRVAYVGLDNRAAGRTAAYIMARFIGSRRSKVAMIAGSLSYRAHEEREMGFLHLFAETFPQVEVVGLRQGFDDPEKNFRQTRRLLADHADLAGVYCIGGGPEGVARALKEARRDQNVVLIGHGLTPESRGFLLDGAIDAVITQTPQATLMNCITIFANLRAGRSPLEGAQPMRAEIIFRENMP